MRLTYFLIQKLGTFFNISNVKSNIIIILIHLTRELKLLNYYCLENEHMKRTVLSLLVLILFNHGRQLHFFFKYGLDQLQLEFFFPV